MSKISKGKLLFCARDLLGLVKTQQQFPLSDRQGVQSISSITTTCYPYKQNFLCFSKDESYLFTYDVTSIVQTFQGIFIKSKEASTKHHRKRLSSALYTRAMILILCTHRISYAFCTVCLTKKNIPCSICNSSHVVKNWNHKPLRGM